jgi:hypothetical protein
MHGTAKPQTGRPGLTIGRKKDNATIAARTRRSANVVSPVKAKIGALRSRNASIVTVRTAEETPACKEEHRGLPERPPCRGNQERGREKKRVPEEPGARKGEGPRGDDRSEDRSDVEGPEQEAKARKERESDSRECRRTENEGGTQQQEGSRNLGQRGGPERKRAERAGKEKECRYAARGGSRVRT